MFLKKILKASSLIILAILLLTVQANILTKNITKAEVIDNKKITNMDFYVFRVSCREDEMFKNIECLVFMEITKETIILLNPHGEYAILMISKDAFPGKMVFMRVDNGRLIKSKPMSDIKYGIVEFEKSDIARLYRQMNGGQYLYIRYFIKDRTRAEGYREITLKVPLGGFSKALEYYNRQITKYGF